MALQCWSSMSSNFLVFHSSGGISLSPDTLAPYLIIICLDYMLHTSIDLMKENGSSLQKKEAEVTPAQTIMDIGYYPCYIVWNGQQVA